MFKVKDLIKATNGKLLQGKENLVVSGVSTDSRTIKSGELFIALKGLNYNGHEFIKDAIKKKAKAIVISEKKKYIYPNNLALILVSDTTVALQDIAAFHRNRFKIPVVAITGSNGKTTTKDMLADILSKKYKVLSAQGTNNNKIGVSKTLLQLNKRHQVVVLELGTNHFGEISNLAKISRPDTAIFTNIGQSHLEFLKSPAAVFKEKYSLINRINPHGLIIFNNDDRYLRGIERKLKGKFRSIAFSIENQSGIRATKINLCFDYLEFLFNNKVWIRLNTPAEHNVYNALAAIACAEIFKLGISEIKTALEEFKFPQRRFNFNRIKEFYLIDDSYNSNPLSLSRAVDILSRFNCGRKILVCGDMLELGKASKRLHFDLGMKIAENGIDILITVGKLSRWIAKGAQRKNLNKKRILCFGSSDQVADKLAKMIIPGDVILVKGSRSIAMEKIVEGIKQK